MEENFNHLPSIMAVLSVIASTIVLSISGTWKISKAKDDILERINANSKAVDEDFQVIRHEFGETVAAIREKINEVELYIRDEYIRRGSFYQVVDSMRAQLDAVAIRVEAQITKLETKIDKLTLR